ncbi:macrophage mannose receptor 1-like protein [Lates japonicus]|uniref:Macrophage mannose receptor 1-like protein n=1 Tax=Lates japonicus TaxID=270547 RepID=A0AAD3RMW9_LATJO|nr:macrophage mannose receptor 1-like protein [Lates japonicus]
MGNKSSPELTLSFLLITALCLEAVHIKSRPYKSMDKMNWTEARLYCQSHYVDLATWNTVKKGALAEYFTEHGINQVWIGLHRDPEKDSVWKWINIKTGEGVSGDDLSHSSDWADKHPKSHCAVIGDDQMWHSTHCSKRNYVYCSEGDHISYHKIDLTWYGASQYCQDMNGNLATITKTNTNYFESSGWIGLYRQAGHTWSWIGDLSSNYSDWAPGEPVTEDCGLFDPVTEEWYSKACSEELHPLCFKDKLVVVNENKTWEEALSYCRNMTTSDFNYDILSPHYSDYSYLRERIYSRATTDEVWIGLRLLGGEWWLVSGEELNQEMLPECPSQWNHCGTLSKHDTNNWIPRDCSERRNFICYGEREKRE